MKINDSANVIVPNPTVGKANSSPNSQANTNINPADAKTNVAGPAVNVDISLTAKLAEVQGDSQATKSTDQALIDKIRNQITNGEFKIDYKKISQAMLGDVVASMGQRVAASKK